MAVKLEDLKKPLAGFNSVAVEKSAEIINYMIEKTMERQPSFELESVTVSEYPGHSQSATVWHICADVFGRRVHIQMQVKHK